MMNPLGFEMVSDGGRCQAMGCGQQASETNPLVAHGRGLSHPMHLNCALAALNKTGKCSFCTRDLDKESLESLKKKVALVEVAQPEARASSVEVLGSQEPEIAESADLPTDEELAKQLDEELNSGVSPAQLQSDEEAARRLQEQLNQGAAASEGRRGTPEDQIQEDAEAARRLFEEMNGGGASAASQDVPPRYDSGGDVAAAFGNESPVNFDRLMNTPANNGVSETTTMRSVSSSEALAALAVLVGSVALYYILNV